MQRYIWKTSIAVTAAAALLLAGCGKKKEQEPDLGLPEITTNVNLVVNPGFEEWDGFKPAGWVVRTFSGKGNKMSFLGRSNKTQNGNHSFYLRGLYRHAAMAGRHASDSQSGRVTG